MTRTTAGTSFTVLQDNVPNACT